MWSINTLTEKTINYSSEEKYLIWKWFKKVKETLLNELKNELKSENNIDKKLLIKEYIGRIEWLKPEIINFSNKKSKVNWDTTIWNENLGKKITIYSQNLSYQDNGWLEILLYHEFQHYIWRDIQWKKEFKNDYRELNAKILSFRYFMEKNSYNLSLDWIEKLFEKVEKEIKSNNWTWEKQNIYSQSEEVELFYIYENFNNNRENLLFYLQNLVKLEELKKETQNT